MKEVIAICPTCGNKASHELIARIGGQDELEDDFFVDVEYIIFQCKTCTSLSLFYALDYSPKSAKELSNLFNSPERTLHPKGRNFSDIVPEKIKKSYLEAVRVKRISPNSFAAMVRRTLELICIDNKANGSDLSKMLKDLNKRNIIPGQLYTMSDALRFLGNKSLHPSEIEIDYGDVWAIDDFISAVIEYVYIAPDKIDKLAKSIAERKTTKTDKNKN